MAGPGLPDELKVYEKGLELSYILRWRPKVVVREWQEDSLSVGRRKVVVCLKNLCSRPPEEVASSLLDLYLARRRHLLVEMASLVAGSLAGLLALLAGSEALEALATALVGAAMTAQGVWRLTGRRGSRQQAGAYPLPGELVSVVEELLEAYCTKCERRPSIRFCRYEDRVREAVLELPS